MKYLGILSIIMFSVILSNCSSDDPPALPEVEFSYDVSSSEVTFTSLVSNTNSLSWDFGDGKTSTQANPVHIYEKSGNFTVKLTAIGDGGSVSATNVVEIFDAPVVDFSTNVIGKEVSFTSIVSDTNSLQWDFGDGKTSTEDNPVHTYESAGMYNVKLTATGDGGTDFVTKSVEIFEEPIVDFTADIKGKEVTFTSQVSNANSLLWDFGDNKTSTEDNPVHSYETPGNYSVKLTATGSGGITSVTKSIDVVAEKPTAGFELSVSDIYQWDSADVIDTSTGSDVAPSYTVTGGEFIYLGNTIQFLEAKTYTITQTVENTGGVNSTSQSVVVGTVDNYYSLDGTDVPITTNAFWYDGTAMGGTVYIRMLIPISGQDNPNLIKLKPIAGPNPLQGTYTWSADGDVIGTYDAGMTKDYAGFEYDWTTNGDNGENLKIELVFEDPINSDNNIYEITLNLYTLNYGDWNFATFEWVSDGTKSLSILYRGKIDPIE